MVLNDEKICTQIAKKPGARAVDLADVFNCELGEMSNALRVLVEVGDVVRVSGTGPNGQPAQLYSLSDTFLKSKEGKKIIAQLEAQATAKPAPAPAPAPMSAQEPLAAASESPAPAVSQPVVAPPISKIQKAIEFIATHGGCATSEMLHGHLGLKKNEHPSSYLGGAVRDGRLARIGQNWRLGAPLPPAETSMSIPRFLASQTEGSVDGGGAAGHKAAAPVISKAVLRCAIWSDGKVELQSDGATVCILLREEADALVGHILGSAA